MVANSKVKRIIPFGPEEDVLLSLWLNYMSGIGYELEDTGRVLGKFVRTEPADTKYRIINLSMADGYTANGWEYAGRFRGGCCIIKNKRAEEVYEEKNIIDSDLISGKLLWVSLGLYIALNGFAAAGSGHYRSIFSLIEIGSPAACIPAGLLIALLGTYIFLRAAVALRFITNYGRSFISITELKIMKGKVKYRMLLPAFIAAAIFVIFINMEVNLAAYLKLSFIPIITCGLLVIYAYINPDKYAVLRRIPVLSICTCITSAWYLYIRLAYGSLFGTNNLVLVLWMITASILYAGWNDNIKMRRM
ncbi:MAG: hypothetical protein Q4C14_08340 [Bacillota bacterium]|nr:hypothetical protein [Bacillota bacterium]